MSVAIETAAQIPVQRESPGRVSRRSARSISSAGMCTTMPGRARSVWTRKCVSAGKRPEEAMLRPHTTRSAAATVVRRLR
ncbi:hypothetical protein BJF85_00595 [Saccharomonospora sp. CUA-673]|nr:hypothetical protein [Saccharomonospora sp. CUA-673]OLT46988.1 hypothetical protein BJF85_00595 [Saccharomonospora sp. CUA-673]